MIRNLLISFLLIGSLTAQNKFQVMMPETDPNSIALRNMQMMVVVNNYEKEVDANIEIKISERGKPLAMLDIKGYKLSIGPNTVNLNNQFTAIDDKKGQILIKGFKLEEGKYVISTHVTILYNGEMVFYKDSVVRDLPERGPIKTMVPPDKFEYEETPNNFMWEPINPVIQDATFKLKIYELKDKEKPEEVVAKHEPIFINMTNFNNQITVVGKGSVPFKRNKTYCWVVTMEVADIELKRSEIKTFKVKKLSPEHDHELPEPVLIDLSKPQHTTK